VVTDNLCPMVPQQSMPGEDTSDHLTLPTVPSVVCCGSSGNLPYGTNTVCRHDIISILDNEYGDNLWNIVYWLNIDMASWPRTHHSFCPISEGFIWEHVTISFVDFSCNTSRSTPSSPRLWFLFWRRNGTQSILT
jgi:hypothetical protein